MKNPTKQTMFLKVFFPSLVSGFFSRGRDMYQYHGGGGGGMTSPDDIHPHVQSSHLALPKKIGEFAVFPLHHRNILIILEVHLRKVSMIWVFPCIKPIKVREKRLLIDLDFIIAKMIKILIIRW